MGQIAKPQNRELWQQLLQQWMEPDPSPLRESKGKYDEQPDSPSGGLDPGLNR